MVSAASDARAFARRAMLHHLPTFLVMVVASLAGHLAASRPEDLRLVAVSVIALAFVAIGTRAPRFLMPGLIVWLASLGLLRRLANSVSEAGSFGDPLLLIAPAVIAVLLLAAVQAGFPRTRSALASAVLFLAIVVVVSGLNPLQGSLVVGLGGLLLTLPPMLMFWVGRSLCDARMLEIVLRLIAGLALPAALYGLVQTLRGFPAWDERWILQSGYAALNVGGVTRAFSSFSSASEYATFLGVGVVAWLAFGLRSPRLTRLPAVLGTLAVLGATLAYASARGTVILLVLSAGLMVAARCGAPLVVAVLVAVSLVALVPFVASGFAPSGDDAGSRLLAHQVGGLADPFGQASTLPGHLQLLLKGLRSGLSDPIGRGIGSVTIAAERFGGSSAGTEADPSNLAVAAGLPGLGAYLVVVACGFGRAYRLAVQRRDAVSLAAMGLLGVTFLHWTNGGQYAVVLLPWLVLGWVERTGGQPASPATVPTS
jgi:hypothetical protein